MATAAIFAVCHLQFAPGRLLGLFLFGSCTAGCEREPGRSSRRPSPTFFAGGSSAPCDDRSASVGRRALGLGAMKQLSCEC